MKTELEIKIFLALLEEKQKEYKPYLIGKKKGLNSFWRNNGFKMGFRIK